MWTVMYNSDLLLRALTLATGRFGRMRPVLITAVAYPMSAKFRTGLTLSMFALVIFTLIFISIITEAFSTSGDTDASSTTLHFSTPITAGPPSGCTCVSGFRGCWRPRSPFPPGGGGSSPDQRHKLRGRPSDEEAVVPSRTCAGGLSLRGRRHARHSMNFEFWMWCLLEAMFTTIDVPIEARQAEGVEAEEHLWRREWHGGGTCCGRQLNDLFTGYFLEEHRPSAGRWWS